ncbi:MAG: lipopolysaccharide biosynthesis protein [Gaiellales bacterium]
MADRWSMRGPVLWAFVMSWGQRLMALVVTFVLAALLGPERYGIVAIAIVFVALLQVFLEQGLNTAVIQREELEPEHVDAAFWMNLVWSIVLTLLAMGLAYPWSRLTDPRVFTVIIALAPTLIFRGLTMVQQAQMQRSLRFKALAARTNASMFTSGVAGLALAFGGAGIWALVAQQVVYDFVSVIVLWTASSWRPRLAFSRRHGRELLSYSLSVFGANLGGFLNRRADALLIGAFFHPAIVGIYRLADRMVDVVLEMTSRPIGSVALPRFSRLQNDAEGLRASVLGAVRLSLTVTAPPLLVIAACSPWLLGALGKDWAGGATALKLLCVVGIVKGLVSFAGPVLFAVGRPRLRASVSWTLAAISVAATLVAGALFSDEARRHQLLGMSGIRAAIFIGAVAPLSLWAVQRAVPGLRLAALLPLFRAPLISGGAALATGYGIERSGVLDDLGARTALLIAGPTVAVVAVAMLSLTDRRARRELLRIGGRLSGRRVRHQSSAA